MSRWRPGWSGAFRMGLEHGASCVGCCWALMLLLFAGGVMNLTVIAALTALVAFEKLTPFGARGARISGVLMIAAESGCRALNQILASGGGKLSGDEVADPGHLKREQPLARRRIDRVSGRVLQHQTGKRLLERVGRGIELCGERHLRNDFGRNLARSGGFEHPHHFARAQGLRASKLHDHVAGRRLRHRGRGSPRHVLIGDPAVGRLPSPYRRTVPLAASNPRAGVSHTSMKYDACRIVYAMPDDFSAPSTARLATVNGNWMLGFSRNETKTK